MYGEFYGLTGLPFQLTPDPTFYFSSAGHAKAMAHLTYGLHQGEGFIIITGEVGAGKTTLVDLLLSQLDKSVFLIAKIVTSQLGGDDMLRMVATAFGIPARADKAATLKSIEEFLAANLRDKKRSLLIVDEAQNLSVAALEELRMLSNLSVDGAASLQGFLLGQPQFREGLASPDLEQLRQRVIAAYHLGPMSEVETKAYISHRLKTVGWRDDPMFSEGAFSAIYRNTDGIPRRINTLCSRVLLFGYLEERHTIDAETVAQVAEEFKNEITGGLTHNAAAAGSATSLNADIEQAVADLATRATAAEMTLIKHDRAIKGAIEIMLNFVRKSA